MVFQVKLKLALTAFEQRLSVFIFLGRTDAGVLFEAAIAFFSCSIFVPFAQAVVPLRFAAGGAGKFILSYLSGLVILFANRRLISCLQMFNYILVLHHLLISINGLCFLNTFLI